MGLLEGVTIFSSSHSESVAYWVAQCDCEIVYANRTYQTNHIILAQMIISGEENIAFVCWKSQSISISTHVILGSGAAIPQTKYHRPLAWCNCGIDLQIYNLTVTGGPAMCCFLSVTNRLYLHRSSNHTITGNSNAVLHFVQVDNKVNIQVPHGWPFVRSSDRWIPLAKGQ